MVQDDLMHVPDNALMAVGSGPLLQEVVSKDTSDFFVRQLDLKNFKVIQRIMIAASKYVTKLSCSTGHRSHSQTDQIKALESHCLYRGLRACLEILLFPCRSGVCRLAMLNLDCQVIGLIEALGN